MSFPDPPGRRWGTTVSSACRFQEEYGGLEADFLYSVIIDGGIGQDNHFGLLAGLHSDIVVPYILSYGSDDLKRKYLPDCISGDTITAVAMTEPNAGSDLASMRTTAVDDGDHVVINGQKTFISNGIVCDLVVLAVRDPWVENPSPSSRFVKLWRQAHRGSRKGESSRKSVGTARTPPSSFSPIAGSPNATGSARRAQVSGCLWRSCSRRDSCAPSVHKPSRNGFSK